MKLRPFLTPLFVIALMLVVVGCSSPPPTNEVPPTPNIEATVEAKVMEVVKALPTATLYPTYTPAPQPTDTPTPPPTNTPTPLPTYTPTPPPTNTPEPKPTPTATPIPLPPPIVFAPYTRFSKQYKKVVNGIWKDSIGNPVITWAYMNVSNKTLDAIEFRICPKNRFGETVKQFGFGDACFIGVTDDVVIPFVEATDDNSNKKRKKGESSDYLPFTSEKYIDLVRNTGYSSTPGYWGEWTMYGFETAVAVDIELVRVHFQDGTVWTENGGYR